MSEDSDRDVDELIAYSLKAAVFAGRKIEAGLQRKPKPRSTLEERCGRNWLRVAEIARKTSGNPDVTVRELVEWEAFYAARAKSVALFGTGGRKDLEAADNQAGAFRNVRRAYESEFGYCAGSGRKLRPSERRARGAGLHDVWFDETRLLAGENSVDSRFYQAAKKHMDNVKTVAPDDLMPIHIKRKGPKQLVR